MTKEGILLRRCAEEILELVDKTENELTEQQDMISGAASIGCGDLATVRMLSKLFRAFHDMYPAVTFDVYTAKDDHVKERMDQGLTYIGLLLEPVNMERYDYIRLDQPEKWGAVMHPHSPLAQLEQITPEDLRGVRLILPRGFSIQSELARWFGEEYEKLNVLFTANLPSSSPIMAHRKLARSITICGSVVFWDHEKISYRPLSPALYAASILHGGANGRSLWHLKGSFSTPRDRSMQ